MKPLEGLMVAFTAPLAVMGAMEGEKVEFAGKDDAVEILSIR